MAVGVPAGTKEIVKTELLQLSTSVKIQNYIKALHRKTVRDFSIAIANRYEF